MKLDNDKRYWAIIGILVILLAIVLIWAATERTRASNVLQTEKNAVLQASQRQLDAQAEQWQQRLTEQAAARQKAMDEEAASLLRLVAVPLGWVVRAEISAKNHGRVRSYFNDLIGYPGIRNIELMDAAGRVLVATDQGREGLPIDASYPAAVQEVDQPSAFQVGSDLFVAAVPIFGLSAKQGTVVLSYERRSAQPSAPVSAEPAAPASATPAPAAAEPPVAAPSAPASTASPGTASPTQ